MPQPGMPLRSFRERNSVDTSSKRKRVDVRRSRGPTRCGFELVCDRQTVNIGLHDWLFDFDNEEDVKRLHGAVLAMAKEPAAAKDTAATAKQFVEQRQRETIEILERVTS
jgi:hypothetical protein